MVSSHHHQDDRNIPARYCPTDDTDCQDRKKREKPHPQPLSKGRGRKASPPAPLQGERGGSKLKGCDSQDRGHTDKICEICEICGTKWRVSKKNTDDTDDTDSQDRGLTDKICEIREIRVTRTEDKGKKHG